MADPQDRVEIQGIEHPQAEPPGARTLRGRKWLSVWFKCCKAHGRMYLNDAGTTYNGHCPSCGARVQATVGSGGTSRRMFETQ